MVIFCQKWWFSRKSTIFSTFTPRNCQKVIFRVFDDFCHFLVQLTEYTWFALVIVSKNVKNRQKWRFSSKLHENAPEIVIFAKVAKTAKIVIFGTPARFWTWNALTKWTENRDFSRFSAHFTSAFHVYSDQKVPKITKNAKNEILPFPGRLRVDFDQKSQKWPFLAEKHRFLT